MAGLQVSKKAVQPKMFIAVVKDRYDGVAILEGTEAAVLKEMEEAFGDEGYGLGQLELSDNDLHHAEITLYEVVGATQYEAVSAGIKITKKDTTR